MMTITVSRISKYVTDIKCEAHPSPQTHGRERAGDIAVLEAGREAHGRNVKKERQDTSFCWHQLVSWRFRNVRVEREY